MKKIVLLSVWIFLCSPLHIAGSAAVGGPVKGNEKAKQVQENFALFTPEELADIPNADLLDRVAVDGRGKHHIDEVRDFAQRYFEFSLYPRPFKRGEIVVIPRSDLTYRYGIVLGRLQQQDSYVVQLNGEGSTKEVKDEYIGRLKAGAKPVLNSIIPGEKKPEVEKQVMGGAGAGASNAGNAAVGGPVCKNENIKGACEGVENPFTIQELDLMVVYYPYEFMDNYIGIVPPWSPTEYYANRQNTVNGLVYNKSKDYFRAFGYSFSPHHTFRRGERVLYPDKNALYHPKNIDIANYFPGIVLGYDAHNKTYIVQSGFIIKNKLAGFFKAEDLAKYKVHLNDRPSHGKNQALFTPEQLDVLPVPYHALSVIGEAAIVPIMENVGGTGGKSIAKAPNASKAHRYFDFNAHNQFTRGELVILERSDKCYRYGIVLGCLESGQYRVQVNKELQKKDMPPQLIGKLKLDFELLDRTPEKKSKAVEESMLAGMQAKTPEVLQLISEMGAEYDPAVAMPIAKIKDAIRDNDMKKLQEALGLNNQYLEAADETGYTPLLFAIYFNNPDAVDLLLEKGANPGKKAAIGHTKEKDSKKELDAYCLAQVLAKDNHKYDAVLARLELYKLENNIAEQDTSCAGDIKVVEKPAAAQQRTAPPGGITLSSDTK